MRELGVDLNAHDCQSGSTAIITGFEIALIPRTISITKERKELILTSLANALSLDKIPCLALASLIGKLIHISLIIKRGMIMCYPLWGLLKFTDEFRKSSVTSSRHTAQVAPLVPATSSPMVRYCFLPSA